MTDDQSGDPRDVPDDPAAAPSGSADYPTRERVRFSERTFALDSRPESDGALSGGVGDIRALGSQTAVFKARVQRGGRISIPDAERESLDIEHGQIVQALVIPLDRDHAERTDGDGGDEGEGEDDGDVGDEEDDGDVDGDAADGQTDDAGDGDDG